ncbi:hypothetical protein GALL_03920 [mine drainage metagenome]|uniref:MetA-pathway of phenol degradation n=1 Tax=mine drainage metagenome TaxID=410659 RepID=A0A1J5TF12_9ZZZZ
MRYGQLAAMLCLTAMLAGRAYAGPADYVYTPNVEYGEREIDFKGGAYRQPNGGYAQGQSIGFGYGATEHWFTELYLKQENIANQVANVFEWENKFQLTETGEYPLDVGFVTELESPLSNNTPWELRVGPLLQTEFGKLQLNGNMLFERAFGTADENGVPYTTNFSYQWQAKYRWQPAFEFGMQGFGDMGKWDAWNRQADQVHRLGPAIFGKLPLGNRQVIQYNTAWLFGASSAAPNHTFRLQVEYEF